MRPATSRPCSTAISTRLWRPSCAASARATRRGRVCAGAAVSRPCQDGVQPTTRRRVSPRDRSVVPLTLGVCAALRRDGARAALPCRSEGHELGRRTAGRARSLVCTEPRLHRARLDRATVKIRSGSSGNAQQISLSFQRGAPTSEASRPIGGRRSRVVVSRATRHPHVVSAPITPRPGRDSPARGRAPRTMAAVRAASSHRRSRTANSGRSEPGASRDPAEHLLTEASRRVVRKTQRRRAAKGRGAGAAAPRPPGAGRTAVATAEKCGWAR